MKRFQAITIADREYMVGKSVPDSEGDEVVQIFSDGQIVEITVEHYKDGDAYRLDYIFYGLPYCGITSSIKCN